MTEAKAAAGCRPIRQQHMRCGRASSFYEHAVFCGLQGDGAKAEAAAWIQAWRNPQKQVCQPAQSSSPATQTAAGAEHPPSQQTAAKAGATRCTDE